MNWSTTSGRNYNAKIGRINEKEVRAWDTSMQYMYRVLGDEAIPKDAGVAIEFRIPHTSKRVDFLISGKDEEKKNNIVIVELNLSGLVFNLKNNKSRIVAGYCWDWIKEGKTTPTSMILFYPSLDC